MRQLQEEFMNTHYLKILQPHFDNILDGSKRCEIRKNDRGFQKGDHAFLEEIEMVPQHMQHGLIKPTEYRHTGRVIHVLISHVTNFMQKEEVVVMSISIVGTISQEQIDAAGSQQLPEASGAAESNRPGEPADGEDRHKPDKLR